MPLEDDQKIRIGGIKFSEKLVQINVASQGRVTPGNLGPSHQSLPVFQLLQQIAQKNINVTFLCHSKFIAPQETSFCVEQDDMSEVQSILSASSITNASIGTINEVGTLTLFPHRNEFSLLGRVLHLFGNSNYPVHSLSTSISAIAINTDYLLLDKIALNLKEILSLPENHAPFRQGFKITQIRL